MRRPLPRPCGAHGSHGRRFVYPTLLGRTLRHRYLHEAWRKETSHQPDGLIKAEYFQDGCGWVIYKFRLYRKLGDKWYTTTTESSPDYYTHRFYTSYAHVANISITNEAIELTVEDKDCGITFTETLPFAEKEHMSFYRP